LSQGGSLPTNLQQVTLQTVAYNAPTCIPSMSNWQVQLCAGVPGGGKGYSQLFFLYLSAFIIFFLIDTCQGDSGGPLMMFSSTNQWILIGLTSSGIGCASANYSGLYTRVAAFQSWISATMNGTSSHQVSIHPLPILVLSLSFISTLFQTYI
jgi:hypothetical protein